MAKQVTEGGVNTAHKCKQVGPAGDGTGYLLPHNGVQRNSTLNLGPFLLGVICNNSGSFSHPAIMDLLHKAFMREVVKILLKSGNLVALHGGLISPLKI